ncbi:MAG: hypothetical protein A2066_14645 [Bacteroidetes bacterium GWB2_41_8]|nr:MAG: hypothetical protein A2066_14645 [Bacteroidetes bacterium GWB2_41_8]
MFLIHYQLIELRFSVVIKKDKMRTTSTLTRVLYAFIIVFFVCLLLDFLALHDIHNDYVSTSVIDRFSPAASSALPEWTKTSGEWSLIRFSFAVKLLITVLTIPVVRALRKKYRLAE